MKKIDRIIIIVKSVSDLKTLEVEVEKKKNHHVMLDNDNRAMIKTVEII